MFSENVRSLMLKSWVVLSAIICIRNLVKYYRDKKRKNDEQGKPDE